VTSDNSFVASLSPIDAFGNSASYSGEEISVIINYGSATTTKALIYNHVSGAFTASITISKIGSYSIRALLAQLSGGSVAWLLVPPQTSW
jgi:hypothetical protein